MKQSLITLLLLLTLLPAQAVKKFSPNPINIAVTLIEKTDSAKIASTCEYYGYTLKGQEDGYYIMKNNKGDEIRLSLESNNPEYKYPTIIVKSKETQKTTDSRLKDLDFKKEGNKYKRVRNMYSRYATQCEPGPKSTLIFKRIPHKR